MNSKLKAIYKILVSVLMLSMSTNVLAVRWVGEAGLHTGGDTLANNVNSSGDSYSIKAGDLLTLGIGPQFDLTDDTHIRTLIGWKSDSIEILDEASIDSADSASSNINFTRFPIDIMYFYQVRNWNFGGGLTYHLHPKLSGGSINRYYEDALGFAVEVDWRLGEFFYLGGKYTLIDYEQKNSTTTVDGNSIGVVLGFVFGDK